MHDLISPELLAEFRALYEKEFGEELSDQEALDHALALVSLFRAVYEPIPVEKAELYKSLE
jgi:hypothetical protein